MPASRRRELRSATLYHYCDAASVDQQIDPAAGTVTLRRRARTIEPYVTGRRAIYLYTAHGPRGAKTNHPKRWRNAAAVITIDVRSRKSNTYGSFVSCRARSESAAGSWPAKFEGAAARRLRRFPAICSQRTSHDHPFSTAWTESGTVADGTPLGALARDLTGVTVIVNGGLHAPDLIERVLSSGEADLVSLGRPALADPHWPAHTRAGHEPRSFDHGMISAAATVQNTNDFLHDHTDARIHDR